jgi:hypothetical protein
MQPQKEFIQYWIALFEPRLVKQTHKGQSGKKDSTQITVRKTFIYKSTKECPDLRKMWTIILKIKARL